MKPIRLRFASDFYVRHGIVVGVTLMIALVLALTLRSAGSLRLLSLLLVALPVLAAWREWKLAARIVDEGGITRHDGRRFLWSDLKRLRDGHWVNQQGVTTSLNNLDLIFDSGRARILVHALENSAEAIEFCRRMAAGTKSLAALASGDAAMTRDCTCCGSLRDHHSALQNAARPEEDTFLPAASDDLKTVKEINVRGERMTSVLQCPQCAAWFLYLSTYEYLATGSEQGQELRRISFEHAQSRLAEG